MIKERCPHLERVGQRALRLIPHYNSIILANFANDHLLGAGPALVCHQTFSKKYHYSDISVDV